MGIYAVAHNFEDIIKKSLLLQFPRNFCEKFHTCEKSLNVIFNVDDDNWNLLDEQSRIVHFRIDEHFSGWELTITVDALDMLPPHAWMLLFSPIYISVK